MNSNRILPDKFFQNPNLTIHFANQLGIVTNSYFIKNLDTNFCTKKEGKDTNSALEFDANGRGLHCHSLSYSEQNPDIDVSKMDKAKVDTFIRESLGIDEDQLAKLKQYYTQRPANFVNGSLSISINNSVGEGILFPLFKKKSNLYKQGEQFFLEIKATIKLYNPDKDITINIPGEIGYQFVLTDTGFKLDKFATNSQLLYDLTVNDKVKGCRERLMELSGIEIPLSEVFPISKEFPKPQNFFARNWRGFTIGTGFALALGGLAVIGLAAAGILTLGILPLVIGGIVAMAVGAALVVGAEASDTSRDNRPVTGSASYKPSTKIYHESGLTPTPSPSSSPENSNKSKSLSTSSEGSRPASPSNESKSSASSPHTGLKTPSATRSSSDSDV